MREKYLGLAIGAILVTITIAVTLLLTKENALQFLTVLLMGIATVYLGFTFSNRHTFLSQAIYGMVYGMPSTIKK